MSINGILPNRNMMQLSSMRKALEDMQQQLATGQRASTYGELGSGRSQSIDLRAKIAEMNGYLGTTNLLKMRMSLLDKAMSRLEDIPSKTAAAIDPNVYNIDSNGSTSGQKAAKLALSEVIGLLNGEADGRYLMSGKTIETKPVVSMSDMLYGTGSKYGLKQVVAERLAADLGTGKLGRLNLGTGGTSDTVTLTRQGYAPPPAASNISGEFGYKIAGATTSAAKDHIEVTTASAADLGTPPRTGIAEVGVKFGPNLQAGDSVSFELTNPDGTTSTVKLTATLSSPPGDGEFTIAKDNATPPKVDLAKTADNFKARLGDALSTKAETSFKAASSMRASETFFNTYGGAMPKRVNAATTSDLATANGLRDATPDDTVEWYQGYNAAVKSDDPNSSPRNDVAARVDGSLTAGYGVRANEPAFAQMVRALAVMTISDFDPKAGTADDKAYASMPQTTDAERAAAKAAAAKNLQIEKSRYMELASRVDGALAFGSGGQKPTDIHTEIAVAGNMVKSAADRQTNTRTTLQIMLDDVEGINKEELTAQILTLQTRMQASYQTSSILNGLSLLNYMK